MRARKEKLHPSKLESFKPVKSMFKALKTRILIKSYLGSKLINSQHVYH